MAKRKKKTAKRKVAKKRTTKPKPKVVRGNKVKTFAETTAELKASKPTITRCACYRLGAKLASAVYAYKDPPETIRGDDGVYYRRDDKPLPKTGLLIYRECNAPQEDGEGGTENA